MQTYSLPSTPWVQVRPGVPSLHGLPVMETARHIGHGWGWGTWEKGPKGRQELDNGLRSHSLAYSHCNNVNSVSGKPSFLSQGYVKNVPGPGWSQ